MSKIFIISGPSGVGKGSIIKELIDSNNLNLQWVRTVTTRPKRADDDNLGRHSFVSKNEFEEMLRRDEFAEYNCYNNNYYGTTKQEIEKAIANPDPSIMEIDVNGSNNLKKLFGKSIVQIFIIADVDDIETRLQKRGMPDNLIKQRLAIASQEFEKGSGFAYRVQNIQNKLDEAVNEVTNIITNNV